jgi:starch synthase
MPAENQTTGQGIVVCSSFKVLFIAAEASPLVKVGGLGDVAGSLPKALRRAGHDVRLAIPHYSLINLNRYQISYLGEFSIPFMGDELGIGMTEVLLKDGTPVYLLGNDRYFDRTNIYGEPDDLERFLIFSRAAVELPKKLNWRPDIFHCHDWHTGMVPGLLKIAYGYDDFYSSYASVFTIHNIAYQGWFDDFFAQRAGLHEYLPPPDDPLRSRAYSMTGLGIYHSDVISTVSKTYAKEILTPEYGMGLEGLIQKRRDSLFGILNGLDYEECNPATDKALAANFDLSKLDERAKNKRALQEKTGLPVNIEIPLLGLAARLVDQKGVDILVPALDNLFREADVQFVLQGTGEFRYEESLRNLEARYPDKARIFLELDFSLARLIFAGCDIYLSPSRFEPCGLSHLIALHYGAIPVVRHTGGLAETIPDYSTDTASGLGFVFESYNTDNLSLALNRALEAYHRKKEWYMLMIRAMKADFSWQVSLPKYEALYKMAQHKPFMPTKE